jgi:hypothetical protein
LTDYLRLLYDDPEQVKTIVKGCATYAIENPARIGGVVEGLYDRHHDVLAAGMAAAGLEPDDHVKRADAKWPTDFVTCLRQALGEQMKQDPELCKQVWSAMANVTWWYHKGQPDEEEFGASFRAAGGIIADIIEEGDYMDWYCCGPYSQVSDTIAEAMAQKGWTYEHA